MPESAYQHISISAWSVAMALAMALLHEHEHEYGFITLQSEFAGIEAEDPPHTFRQPSKVG